MQARQPFEVAFGAAEAGSGRGEARGFKGGRGRSAPVEAELRVEREESAGTLVVVVGAFEDDRPQERDDAPLPPGDEPQRVAGFRMEAAGAYVAPFLRSSSTV